MLGYIYTMTAGTNNKFKLPKNVKKALGLVQQFLVLQVFLPMAGKFTLETMITDTQNV